MKRQTLVGLAIGVIRDGQVAYARGYGWSDRERRVPVHPLQTKFRWASISKTLTAVTAMQLVEQGKLNLDADIRKYVPEFPQQSVPITTRQLLCHQGGIVHYSNGKVVRTSRKYANPHPYANVINALDLFKESPLIAKPGTKFSYTTHGYILLSAVVQRAGKQAFAEQVSLRICRPLQLRSLVPDYQWQKIAGRAIGYRKRNGIIVPSTNTDVSWKLGGGGFLSNVHDLASYAAALSRGELLQVKSRRIMWRGQTTSDGKLTRAGLGFFVAGDEVSHNGSQEKTKTRLVFVPRKKFGVVVMTNSEYANPTEIAQRIRAALKNR